MSEHQEIVNRLDDLRHAEIALARVVRSAHARPSTSLRSLARTTGLSFATVKAMVERTGKWQMS